MDSNEIVDVMEERIRSVIDTAPELKTLPESLFCKVVLEVFDLIGFGLKMRLEELEEEED